MPPKERSPHLLDPRADAPVRGVSNRDARDVLDAHEAIIEGLLADREADGAEEALAQELAILVATAMFRARNFIDFDAYAVDKLGLDRDEAHRLAQQGAEILGIPAGETFSDLTVAAFFRAEAALSDAGVEAIVGLAIDEGDSSERLLIDLDGAHAARALHAIGGRMTPIALDQAKLRERAEEDARRWEASRRPAWDEGEQPDAPAPEQSSADAEGDGFAPPRPKRAESRPRESFDDRGPRGRDRFDDRGPRGRDRFDDRGPRGRDRFDDRGGPRGRDRFDDRGPGGRDRFDNRGPGGRDRFDNRGPGGRDRFDDRGGPGRPGGRDRFDDRGGPGRPGGRDRFDSRGGPGGRDRFDNRGGPGGRDRFDDRGAPGRPSGRDRFDDRGAPGRPGGRDRFDDRGGFKKREGDLYTAKSKRFRKK